MATYRRRRRALQASRRGKYGLVVPIDNESGHPGERRYGVGTSETTDGLSVAYWVHNDNPDTYTVEWTEDGPRIVD